MSRRYSTTHIGEFVYSLACRHLDTGSEQALSSLLAVLCSLKCKAYLIETERCRPHFPFQLTAATEKPQLLPLANRQY